MDRQVIAYPLRYVQMNIWAALNHAEPYVSFSEVAPFYHEGILFASMSSTAPEAFVLAVHDGVSTVERFHCDDFACIVVAPGAAHIGRRIRCHDSPHTMDNKYIINYLGKMVNNQAVSAAV
jgi:hypothetical protein